MESVKEIYRLDDEFESEETARYVKPFMFIKGFAAGRRLPQTQLALSLARRLHEGQRRLDGQPYLTHPLTVCSALISYGIDDDVTLAAALLHDTLEDCADKLPLGGRELVVEYGLDPEVLELVRMLTKQSGLDDQQLSAYFKRIESDPRAALVKLSDRLHNSSTLYTFTYPKMRKYLRETDKFLIPMGSYCKKYYPTYANAFSILKREIESLNQSMGAMLEKLDGGGERRAL